LGPDLSLLLARQGPRNGLIFADETLTAQDVRNIFWAKTA
jgi:hypothetical protein